MTNDESTTPTLAEVEQLDDYHALNGRFDFWSVQLAGDNASHMPQYMCQHVIMPDGPVADLERAIDPRLED